MEKEKVKAIQYRCGFKDFEEKSHWSTAIWELFNAKNCYSNSIIKLDVLQYGKDEDGFYENYINLIVPIDSNIDWDRYLSSLGYGYVKEEINIMMLYPEWREDIDEYVVEIV